MTPIKLSSGCPISYLFGRPHHELKIHPLPFKAIRQGLKKSEIRINDRNFQAFEFAVLREWYESESRYSGLCVFIKILHVQDRYGLKDGHVCLSFEVIPHTWGRYEPLP